MSRTRIVKGNYTKIIGENYNVSAEGNISYNAINDVRDKGIDKGVSYGNFEKLGSEVSDDFEIRFSLRRDNIYTTVVPFGILDYSGNYENSNFVFDYSLMVGNIDSLEFKILNEDGTTLYSVTNLPEVVISARKLPLLEVDLEKNKPIHDSEKPISTWDWKLLFDKYNTISNDYTKIGSYVIFWDGFDNDDIYDSTNFINKKLKAIIKASKKGIEKTAEVEFTTKYKEVDWVDIKIDRKNKKIDTTLRVNLKDGGEYGLKCVTGSTNAFEPSMTATKCPWDKIPKTELITGKNPIKTRTRTFADLEKLALDGIKKHWSRKGKYLLNICSDDYIINTNPINSRANSLNALDLIYNTNDNWGRSGNAGILGKIYYNVGYCNFLDWYEPSFINDWGYLDEKTHKVDEDFMYTSAHELGHTILKAYGSIWYSFTHDDSSQIWQTPNGNKSYPAEKSSGEINLMHYFEDDPYQSHYDYNLIMVSKNDMLGLIWLTKIEIK